MSGCWMIVIEKVVTGGKTEASNQKLLYILQG